MSGDITLLLQEWKRGDPEALDKLTPLVYSELRRLAGHHLRSRSNSAYSPTELVNEAYLRIAETQPPELENRAHFVSFVARVMRRVLVDTARSQWALKRGALQTIPLDSAGEIASAPARDLLALDDALRSLARFDERKASVLELRYFGGLTSEEIAGTLNVSVPTVTRDLRSANAWLKHHLNSR